MLGFSGFLVLVLSFLEGRDGSDIPPEARPNDEVQLELDLDHE